jgi:cytoskeletal protein CcmA (bactofilin family)
MAIWKDQFAQKKDETTPAPEPMVRAADPRPELSASSPPPRVSPREIRESLISSELTIEGKIEGAGSVRIEGRFKGEVHVQGNLSIEAGAKLTGGVRANTIVIAGELEGNITDASRVELRETGVLTGDVKAGAFTVAAGSRMRGQVEFGWDESAGRQKSAIKMEGGSAA